MPNHKTRAQARKSAKTLKQSDRIVAAAWLAAHPVRVVEDFCVGGADEPYHITLVEAARRLRAEERGFGDVWFDGEDTAPGERRRVWLWQPGGTDRPSLLEGAAFWREALGWLRGGGGVVNVTLEGCLPSSIHFSLGVRPGDMKRTQDWVRACREAGRPVRV